MKRNTAFARLMEFAGRLRSWAEDLLFPEGVTCLSCGCAPRQALENGLCESCVQALDALGRRQQERKDTRSAQDGLAFVHAAFPYEEPARRLIRALKYDRVKSAAQPLIEAMAMLPSGEEEIIVPVPTTKKRLRERGFNQSALLAEGIGQILGMRVEDILERDGEQRAQANLSGRDRLNNLSGCMRAVRRVDGMRILLVDDVYTTGATAKEAARALYEAGAKSIGVFAAARALSQEEQPEFLQNKRSERREDRQEG